MYLVGGPNLFRISWKFSFTFTAHMHSRSLIAHGSWLYGCTAVWNCMELHVPRGTWIQLYGTAVGHSQCTVPLYSVQQTESQQGTWVPSDRESSQQPRIDLILIMTVNSHTVLQPRIDLILNVKLYVNLQSYDSMHARRILNHMTVNSHTVLHFKMRSILGCNTVCEFTVIIKMRSILGC